MSDSAELKRLQDENRNLTRRLEEFEALMRLLPVGIGVAFDPDCKDIRVNTAFADMLGIPVDENGSLSREDADVLPFRVYAEGKEVAPEDLPMQRAAREGIVVRDFEFDLVRRDGAVLREFGHAVPLFGDSGKTRGCVGVFLDITERRRIEDQREQALRQLRAAMSVGQIGTWEINLADCAVSAAGGTNAMHHLPAEGGPYTVEDYVRAMTPESRVAAKQQATAVKRGGELYFEYEVAGADGTRRTILARGELVVDADGRASRLVGAIVDITDQKIQEQARRQAEERWRALFSQAAVGMSQVDVQTGRFLAVNPRLADLSGYSIQELESKTIFEITDRQHLAEVAQNWGELVAGGRKAFSLEQRLVRADGNTVWAAVTVSGVYTSEGVLEFATAVMEDITTRKRAEAALEESTRRFRMLSDSAPVMIWVADASGAATWFNKPWLGFTGRTLAQELGDGWIEGLHPEDAHRILEQYKEHLHLRTPVTFEYRLRRKDGTFRWVMDHGLPLFAPDGSFEGFIGSCIDVQGLKESEQALRRANADLQQFAYSASHDLREPLRNVAIFSELISVRYGNVFDERGKEYLSYVTEGARRMDRLVSDLLAYTQTAAELEEPAPECDAGVALEAAIQSLEASIAECGARIEHNGLPKVRMGSTHLQQVFQNLIGNAMKYRSDQVPEIAVSAHRRGSEWWFAVQDNGIGIDPQYRERIFGIFKRLHTNRKYSGTGIGLAICQRLIERYGGRIWVESAVGQGATFRFTVPAAPEGA